MTTTPETSTLAAQIEALAERATPGQWLATERRGYHELLAPAVDCNWYGHEKMHAAAYIDTELDEDQQEANAVLICLLKNNLPAIVTALRQAEAAPGVVEAAQRIDDLREKLGAKDRGETVLLLAEDDRDKAACQMPDDAIAKWARWALVMAAGTYAKKAQREKRDVAEVMAMHAVVTLACLVHDSNAESASFSVEGARWANSPEAGDWRVTIERTDTHTALARQHGAREGYVLVPREPTDAMVEASIEAVLSYKQADDEAPETIHNDIWTAMIAAAPAADMRDGPAYEYGYTWGPENGPGDTDVHLPAAPATDVGEAKLSVKEAGEAVPAEVWRKALACGDFIDRLPCGQCGATNLSQCINPFTPEQLEATRDYVNGYGWKAAESLTKDTQQ